MSLLLCLIGNSLVLYGTIVHKAVQLDKLSVWIVQNLAMVDICNGLLTLLPVIVTLYAREQWVLGAGMCKAASVYKFCFLVANLILINALTINKLNRCCFPLRNLGSSGKDRAAVTMATIIISIVPAVSTIYFIDIAKVKYVYYIHDQCFCAANFKDSTEARFKNAEMGIGFLLNVIPCVLLILTNCLLLLLAVLKTRRHINKKNMAVVIIVTLVFLVSILPYFAYYVIFPVWDGTATPGLRTVTFISAATMFANPIVYFATNERFRQFTVTQFQGKLQDFKALSFRSTSAAAAKPTT